MGGSFWEGGHSSMGVSSRYLGGQNMKQNDKLKRQLGFWDSVAINIGIVIGVGIFRVPAEIAKYLHSSEWTLLAWAVGGLIALAGVFCYSEMASLFPHTGGTYVFLREAYGRRVGFLFGWMEFCVLRAGSLAGISYVFSAYLRNALGLPGVSEKGIAVTAILFFTLLNIGGLQYGRRVQNILSALKVVTLLGISIAIFSSHLAKGDGPITPPSGFSFWQFFPALIPVLWGYGGWNESTFMSGEFKDTRRALPLSLVTSIFIVTGLYLFINVGYLKVMTPDAILHSPSIASDIFYRLFGQGGRRIITVAVLVSASGALNSTILTGARIPFAVAQDSPKLAWLGSVHSRFGTPYAAFWANSLWAVMLVLWGNFEELLFFTGFAKWFFFTLAGLSVFILRRKYPETERFRLPGYPWVPLFFTVVAMTLCLTTILSEPRAALFGVSLLLMGLPVYGFLHRARKV